MSEEIPTSTNEQPNALRRKLTKGGLGSVVVLATLASKPVLGATPWNCTISGQVSGNMSGHEGEVCSTLGYTPMHWRYVSTWPNHSMFFTTTTVGSRGAKLFASCPDAVAYAAHKFADAYTSSVRPGLDATIWEVINANIMPKGAHATVDLGVEAVTALLNAMDPVIGYDKYPVSPWDVIEIFNQIAADGSYTTEFGADWGTDRVVSYFRLLHTP